MICRSVLSVGIPDWHSPGRPEIGEPAPEFGNKSSAQTMCPTKQPDASRTGRCAVKSIKRSLGNTGRSRDADSPVRLSAATLAPPPGRIGSKVMGRAFQRLHFPIRRPKRPLTLTSCSIALVDKPPQPVHPLLTNGRKRLWNFLYFYVFRGGGVRLIGTCINGSIII